MFFGGLLDDIEFGQFVHVVGQLDNIHELFEDKDRETHDEDP